MKPKTARKFLRKNQEKMAARKRVPVSPSFLRRWEFCTELVIHDEMMKETKNDNAKRQNANNRTTLRAGESQQV